MDTIAHFTPLKNLPCCYYWKDFDRTLNWHLNSLLAINIKRCYNDCNFIVRQLDFAKIKEKASYLNVNFYVLEDIFEAFYPSVFSFNEFLSLVEHARYQDLFLVDSSNLTEIPAYENSYSYVRLRFHDSIYFCSSEFKDLKKKENFFEKALIKNEKTFKKEDDSIFNYYCFLFNKIKRVLMEFEGIYRNRIALSVWRGCKSDFVINPECINSAKETLQKITALKDILIEVSK